MRQPLPRSRAAAPPVAAGLKGFYRGLSATVVSDVWGIGMGFVFYDLANSAFTKLTGRKPKASEKGLLGVHERDGRLSQVWPT